MIEYIVVLFTQASTSSSILYQVIDNCASYLLNIEKNIYTCNKFQVDNISYVFVGIAKIKEDSYSYWSLYLTVEMHIQTYNGTVSRLETTMTEMYQMK